MINNGLILFLLNLNQAVGKHKRICHVTMNRLLFALQSRALLRVTAVFFQSRRSRSHPPSNPPPAPRSGTSSWRGLSTTEIWGRWLDRPEGPPPPPHMRAPPPPPLLHQCLRTRAPPQDTSRGEDEVNDVSRQTPLLFVIEINQMDHNTNGWGRKDWFFFLCCFVLFHRCSSATTNASILIF